MFTVARRFLLATSLFLISNFSAANEPAVDRKTITFWSDGYRLTGDIFRPSNVAPQEEIPGILLVHGWGGNRTNLNRAYAPQFAGLGFIVMTFDMRSWGDSDGFWVANSPLPTTDQKKKVAIDGLQFRSIVNPIKQVEDARAALAWLMGEPGLDKKRVGIWGTSLGGGIAVVVAAHDPRVKALVSQIGAVNNKASFKMIPDEMVREWETKRARGELSSYPGPESAAPGLRGYPDMIAMKSYDPAAHWTEVSVPTLIIDAEDEELFDRTINGQALYAELKPRTDAKYLVIPGKHYDIYRDDGYATALKAAQQWFTRYLQ